VDNEQIARANAGGNAMVLAQYNAKQAQNSGPVQALTRGAQLREFEANRAYALQQGDLVEAEYFEKRIDQLCGSARDAWNQRVRDEQGRFASQEPAPSFDGGARRPPGRTFSPFDRHDWSEQTGTQLMKTAMRRSVQERHERDAAGADGSIDLFGDNAHQAPGT
jgi:hypothetical protein